jgi:hypothetical protein
VPLVVLLLFLVAMIDSGVGILGVRLSGFTFVCVNWILISGVYLSAISVAMLVYLLTVILP